MLKLLPSFTNNMNYAVKLPKLVKLTPKNLGCRIQQSLLLAINLPSHLHLGGKLQSHLFSGFVEHHSRIQYKYLGEYLVYQMSANQKLNSLIDNYDFFIDAGIKSNALMSLTQGISLWSHEYQDVMLSIHLTVPELTYREGEWVLSFMANHSTIFTMTFTIMAENVLNRAAGEEKVLFIGGTQGTAGCSDWIKLAAKAYGDIFPSIQLFTAVQALAMALGLNKIIAVTAAKQISPAVHEDSERYVNLYDKFWESQGGELVNGFYEFAPLPAEKAAEELSGKHAARSRRKRQMRKALLDTLIGNCQRILLGK